MKGSLLFQFSDEDNQNKVEHSVDGRKRQASKVKTAPPKQANKLQAKEIRFVLARGSGTWRGMGRGNGVKVVKSYQLSTSSGRNAMYNMSHRI